MWSPLKILRGMCWIIFIAMGLTLFFIIGGFITEIAGLESGGAVYTTILGLVPVICVVIFLVILGLLTL